MEASLVLALLAVACALAAVGIGVAIANELRERGIRANPLFVKWMIFRYMAVYRRVTLEETGEIGPLYHACSVVSALAGILGVAAIISKLW